MIAMENHCFYNDVKVMMIAMVSSCYHNNIEVTTILMAGQCFHNNIKMIMIVIVGQLCQKYFNNDDLNSRRMYLHYCNDDDRNGR